MPGDNYIFTLALRDRSYPNHSKQVKDKGIGRREERGMRKEGKGNDFFEGVAVGKQFRGWPHMCAYTGSTNWTW